jgi:predicted NBD/HSP70 family sugar kinase
MAPLQRNASRVFSALVSRQEGMTRAEVANATGLSRPTVGAIVQELAEQGLIELAPAQAGAIGRPPGRLRINPRAGIMFGVDIGHSHVVVAVADAAGTLMASPLTRRLDVDHVGVVALEYAVETMADALEPMPNTPLVSVGVGMPARVSTEGRVIAPGDLPAWAHIGVGDHVERMLSERLGHRTQCSVAVDSRTNLGALAEHHDGAAQGCDHFIYVSTSNSIGVALFLDGRLYRGHAGMAGEFGHIAVPDDVAQTFPDARAGNRTPCPICGQPDCLEMSISRDALAAALSDIDPQYTGDRTMDEVVAMAVEHPTEHPRCLAAVIGASRRIGAALRDLVAVLDPELIVVGGSLAAGGNLVVEELRRTLLDHRLRPRSLRVVCVSPERVGQSEVYGAIALANTRIRAGSGLGWGLG